MNYSKRFTLTAIAQGVGLAACPILSRAQNVIDISGVGGTQIPVAIGNFTLEAQGASQIADVIRSNLSRIGMFKVVDAGPLSDTASLKYEDYRGKGADALVGGRVSAAGGGRLEVRYRLHDVVKQTTLGGSSIGASTTQQRLAGHRIADEIVEKLTGEKGIFSTRIAFVSKQAGRYHLNVADWDGDSIQTALLSPEPIISPTWSPDGSRVAYVSFENKKPVVYVQNIATEQRIAAANFKGSNSAPSWSPDGSKLAVALSKDGLSQIYLVGADGSNPKRLTISSGIDTEPQFSRDGRFVYFTSDRSGAPQIYRINANGGDASRVTFNSAHSTSPRLSPDGKLLAFVSRRNGGYFIAIKDLNSGQEQVLSDGGRDESPSFAPNSRWLMYASKSGSRDVLMTMSVEGKFRQQLSSPALDIREPAWGTYVR